MSTTTGPVPAVNFERVPTEYYPETTFRPNTIMHTIPLNLMFINGGMGDYICWMPALEWLMNEARWIKGHAIIPTYFVDFAKYFIEPHMPKWGWREYSEIPQIPNVNNIAFRGPVELQRESLNATGAHLLTCGWVYFTNKEKAPPGYDRYPVLKQPDLDNLQLQADAEKLIPGKYAVITTGQTTNSRVVPQGAWNYIIEYVRELGLTPVFLGKSRMTTGNPMDIHTRFDPTLRFDLGVDLRDKTDMMQAAAIMSRAAGVVGHDNGLLHLAGCTNVPIVFGYNIAAPEHREPRRAVGRVYNVTLGGFGKGSELPCNFCQSNNNFVIGYNYRECFHRDLRCMSMLFDNRGARWKKQIDAALAGGCG